MMHYMKRIILAHLVFMCTLGTWGQERAGLFDISHSVDWIRSEMTVQAGYNLILAGIKLPAGRTMAEDTLAEAYPALLRPCLLPIQVDSASTIQSLVERGELSLEEIDAISRSAAKIPVSITQDFSRMVGRYNISLGSLGTLLTRHRAAKEPERPLTGAPAPNYTSIIIIADEELSVHGRNTKALTVPCLFPKIWDSDMNLVYERSMNDPATKSLMVRYDVRESIFRPTPSGLDGELAAFAGSYPLRLLAREVFGIAPTDLVIDRDDALKILSNENNRRLLREGRVIFVLNTEALAGTGR